MRLADAQKASSAGCADNRRWRRQSEPSLYEGHRQQCFDLISLIRRTNLPWTRQFCDIRRQGVAYGDRGLWIATSHETTDMKLAGFSIARMGRALAGEFRARDHAKALRLLDDRMLADMGVMRGEIDGLVRGTAKRRG